MTSKNFQIEVKATFCIPLPGEIGQYASASCYRCQSCDKLFLTIFPPGQSIADEHDCPKCDGTCSPDYDANEVEIKRDLYQSGQLRDLWERHIIPHQKQSLQPFLRHLVGKWPKTPEISDLPVTPAPKLKKRTADKPASLELRKQIWDRDRYTCQVCGLKIPWERYECGHMVDRFLGGPSAPDNLVVMCEWCNKHKPTHHTKDEYFDWLRSGYWKMEMFQEFKALLIRCHEDDLIRQGFNPDDDLVLDNIRYFQMHRMGLIDHYPSLIEQVEWKKNGLFPEWKEHE